MAPTFKMDTIYDNESSGDEEKYMIGCHDLKYMIPKHIPMRYVLRERVPCYRKYHPCDTMLNVSINRFKKKLSGTGMFVRKHSGKNRVCL